jgi:Phytochelatin synthase
MVQTTRYAYFTFILNHQSLYEHSNSVRRFVNYKNRMSTMTWTTLSTSADMMDSTPKEQQPPVRFANNDSPHTMNGEIAISKMTDDFIPANVSNSSSTPKTTFYRRSLPDTCIAFSSKQGRKFFESAMKNHGLKSYFHLMEQYTTQSEPAFCGISTLVIALNALAVDPRQIWKGSWRWYEESMLNCCIDLEQAKDTGITMSVS